MTRPINIFEGAARARIARAQRRIELCDFNARSDAECAAEFRAKAEMMGTETDIGKEWIAYADKIERGDPSWDRVRANAIEELRAAQAELDRLAAPDAEPPC